MPKAFYSVEEQLAWRSRKKARDMPPIRNIKNAINTVRYGDEGADANQRNVENS